MIMLTLVMMLAQAASPATDASPIAPLPGQSLPIRGCAAFLFAPGDKPLFMAMASADPAQLRVALGGTVTDLPRAAQSGAGGFGFGGVTEYEAGGVKAVLDMTIETRADLKDGAAIKDATLRIERAGQDGVVVPLAGIVACAK
ncbi:hypothetical protein ACFOKI_13655 [Sphingomonas qilianensis]|uniref:Uncharacterized protein n=1 Tax=Sphingomonas qilianensis TaxID=1736690 RepID=A0ABU9XN16_9SPHN